MFVVENFVHFVPTHEHATILPLYYVELEVAYRNNRSRKMCHLADSRHHQQRAAEVHSVRQCRIRICHHNVKAA